MAGRGSQGGRAERREGDGERGTPAAGRADSAVHPLGIQQMPAHHTYHHHHHHAHLYNIDPEAGDLIPPQPPPTPAPAVPPPCQGRSRRGWPLPRRRGGGARRRRRRHRGRRGSRRGGTGDPALGPGLGHGSGPPGGRGPPPGGGSVRVAELGLLGNHQGDEEPALRCRAPLEGREEPGGAPGGVGGPRGPQEGPQGGDWGGVA